VRDLPLDLNLTAVPLRACREATGEQRANNQMHLVQYENGMKYAGGGTGNFTSPMMFGSDVFLSVKVADPEDAKRILRDHVQKPVFYKLGFLGHGLLGQGDNDAWQQQRKHLKPAFAVKSLTKLMPLMSATSNEVVAELRRAEEAGAATDIWEVFHRAAFLMIGHSALGEESDWLAENAAAMQDAFSCAVRPQAPYETPEEFKRSIKVRVSSGAVA
jgi:cytochrome P450